MSRRLESDLDQQCIATGIVANANGSSCIDNSNYKVVCSVRGPLQLTTEYRGSKGKIVCNVSFAPFALAKCRITSSSGITLEKEIALIMESICEQVVILEAFPQLVYELNFAVLSTDGGSLIPALCSTACSALMEAGVEMLDVFAASTAALVRDPSSDSSQFVIKPSATQRLSGSAMCTLAATTSTGKPLYFSHEGASTPEQIANLFTLAMEGCKRQRKTILKSV